MNVETVRQNKDLRDNITSIFANHGQPNPAAWRDHLSDQENKEIEDAIERQDQPYQRFIINRFLRGVLGRLSVEKNVNTHDARFCIFENDTIEAWVRHLSTIPVKCIIENSLCGMVNPNASTTTTSE